MTELDLLTHEGPTQAELDRVGNLYAARTAAVLERIGERADQIGMSPPVLEAMSLLRRFMFDRAYVQKEQEARAAERATRYCRW